MRRLIPLSCLCSKYERITQVIKQVSDTMRFIPKQKAVNITGETRGKLLLSINLKEEYE